MSLVSTRLCLLTVVVLSCFHASGVANLLPGKTQMAAPPSTAKFEVVSIRPSGKEHPFMIQRDQRGFRAYHTNMWVVIMRAFLPMPLWSNDRLEKAPNWVTKDNYDIVANVAPEDIAKWNGPEGNNLERAMLQDMLADRFGLVLHTRPAPADGYALISAKGALRLTPSSGNQPAHSAMKLSHGGSAVASSTSQLLTWAFYGAPMSSLADFLSTGAHTLVQDETGLKGTYDFVLQRRSDVVPTDDSPTVDPNSRWELAPLGLKTRRTKIPSEVLIIDSIHPPTEN